MSEIVTVYKRNHRGESIWKYAGEVLERGPAWVCLRAYFDRGEVMLGFTTFRRGDLFIEWFFSDRWYNIFEVHEGDSEYLKGWYCNITRPAIIGETSVMADDLELDVFVMPNGTVLLLDEKEFNDLDLPTDERMNTLRAVQDLRRLVADREAPFDKIRHEIS
jgi:hypothetical protein